MLLIKTYEEIKNIKAYNKILQQNINEIKQKLELQKYQINNLELDIKIWAKILDNRIKKIEKKTKRSEKKK